MDEKLKMLDLEEKLISFDEAVINYTLDNFCNIQEVNIISSDNSVKKDYKYLIGDSNDPNKMKSRKLKNIILNWKTLLSDTPENILTIIGSISQPWTIPLAALVIWSKLWSYSELVLDEKHAIAISSFWKITASDLLISNHEALKEFNKSIKKYIDVEISQVEFGQIIKDLQKIGCIKILDNDQIKLVEKLKTVSQ